MEMILTPTDHLSPPSTTSRLSDSDTTSECDIDGIAASRDGASISSLGSSSSPPPEVKLFNNMKPTIQNTKPQYTQQHIIFTRWYYSYKWKKKSTTIFLNWNIIWNLVIPRFLCSDTFFFYFSKDFVFIIANWIYFFDVLDCISMSSPMVSRCHAFSICVRTYVKQLKE